MRRLVRFARPLLSALALFASLPAGAANVAPELVSPLADLTLAIGATSAPLDLANRFRDPDVTGPAVRVAVRLGTETRRIDLALLPDAAPQTVANFLAYVDAGRYAANFIHRSVPGFIVQNGGFFFVNDTTFDLVPTYAAVNNEPGLSNTRGTVAMAKLGDNPDSATSQWFINLADNSANLDAQNGGFTVFARVLGQGMQVADAIAAVPRYNASNIHPAWNEIPLTAAALAREYFIETNVTRVAPLSFAVSSDDPALVTATLDVQGVLTLTASASTAGRTTIRLTATDLEGATLASSFSVTVLSANPFIAWRQTHFAATADTGRAANLSDPDSDNLPNLLEYALGGDPLSPSSASLPVLQVSGAGPQPALLTLTYKRAAIDVTYSVQTSTNLAAPASWTPDGVTQGTPDAEGVTTASIPRGTGPRFLRLGVALDPEGS